MKPKILICDDEMGICVFLSLSLEDNYDVSIANNPDQAYQIIKEKNIQLVLLDLMLGEFYGLDVLKHIKANNPEVAVIVMTAFGDITSSVEAIKGGAFYYLCKPLNLDELNVFITQALEYQNLNRQVKLLDNELHEMGLLNRYGEMVGKSPQMQRVYQMISRVKNNNISVIITGESGTGKELVARAIHQSGNRQKEKFVAVNCAAIPEGLLEEEFFGHKKGSFTGASSDRLGKLELANNGTLFLDEIGDMPLSLQAKLLRVLQEKEIAAIGSNVLKKIDIRIISATNKNLREMVQQGKFRQDLFYRLHVIEINVPPLRERKQDIPELCEEIISNIIKEKGIAVNGFTKQAEKTIMKYDYPGNVRELINILEYAIALCDGNLIDVDDLPVETTLSLNADNNLMNANQAVKKLLKCMSLKEIEKIVIEAKLENSSLSRKEIAKQLGISERNLFYKMRDYNL